MDQNTQKTLTRLDLTASVSQELSRLLETEGDADLRERGSL